MLTLPAASSSCAAITRCKSTNSHNPAPQHNNTTKATSCPPTHLHDDTTQALALEVPPRRLALALPDLLSDLLPKLHHIPQKTALDAQHLKKKRKLSKHNP
jgi:hypothetical protein